MTGERCLKLRYELATELRNYVKRHRLKPALLERCCLVQREKIILHMDIEGEAGRCNVVSQQKVN